MSVSCMMTAVRRVLLAALMALAVVPPAAAQPPLTVVELFTSQGCSSCPPANALIGELADRDGILALSHHVDYWDYLGWRDTLARPGGAERQRAYARTLGLSYVYTPQVVIQGAYQATGSDREEVLDRIARARPGNPLPVAITRVPDDKMVVAIGARSGADDAAVWLALFDRQHVTPVAGGENEGRILRTFNVVRRFTRIGSWNGEAMSISVPAPRSAASGEAGGCAVIVQAGEGGRVLGAARLILGKN
jgi:hypothetical protein